jgi:ribosomal protein S27E
MAYLTCPDCMMPSPVGDDAVKFACMSCWTEIVFETCPECGYKQSIPSRWHTAYTCGKCGIRCELPRRRMYSTSTKALGVEGYGYVYPKL